MQRALVVFGTDDLLFFLLNLVECACAAQDGRLCADEVAKLIACAGRGGDLVPQKALVLGEVVEACVQQTVARGGKLPANCTSKARRWAWRVMLPRQDR
jgi:hypothetical protein